MSQMKRFIEDVATEVADMLNLDWCSAFDLVNVCGEQVDRGMEKAKNPTRQDLVHAAAMEVAVELYPMKVVR